MRSFHDISIRSKLMVLLLLTSFSGLLLVAAAIGIYEAGRVHHSMVHELSGQAEILAANSAAAVAAGDTAASSNLLAGLSFQAEITDCRLFTAQGRLLAEYHRNASSGALVPAAPRTNHGSWREAGDLVVARPVRLGSQIVGTLTLGSDLAEERARARAYASIGAVVVFLALLVALLLSIRLQQIVLRPILSLSEVARTIAQKHDYSLRAPKETNDEVGLLIASFNRMLEHIQRSDRALRESELRFRQMAEAVREVFWLYDPVQHRLLYISPSYEEVWGRTCTSRYSTPDDWLEAVHADDRERVLEAFMSQASRGHYDEEYRIVRPDGGVRWIHDRAVPVRDEKGMAYRVAGIAEDITRRKQLEMEILKVSEYERTRIGQDLHDGLCQRLIRVAFAANLLQRDLAHHHRTESPAVRKICSLLDQAITEARQLARGLYPVKLAADGLAAALADLAHEAGRDNPVQCVLDCPEEVPVHNQTTATHLYRIAQEAVSNALKHSEAKHIEIGLRADARALHLTVADDGIGLTAKTRSPKGMGLQIMNYRARMIGGRLEIRKGAHGGTIAQCSIPRRMLH